MVANTDATKVTFKLNNGYAIPALGLGTANYGDRVPPTKDAVIAAVKAGYRHIDAAWIYQTENEVGAGLKELFDEGVVKREDLFITTKVDASLADNPERSLTESLKKLGIDYVDLLLQHWPIGKPQTDANGNSKDEINYNYIEPYQLIEELYLNNKDKIRSIGVSNYSIPFLTELLKVAKVKPVLNQIELHPHLPQVDVVSFNQENGILITAYSPAGSTGAPNLEIPIVKELAKKYNTTANAILSSYHIKEGRVVIPKSINAERIKSAAELVDLSQEDLAKLTDFGVKNPARFIKPEFGKKLGFDNW
jgi:D-arabinose 1-dehydrogenase